MRVSRSRFEALVAQALNDLPDEFQDKMHNVDLVIADWPTRGELRQAGLRRGDMLFGLYQGVPLTKRTTGYGLVLPDKITIYQGPIEAVCRTPRQIRHKVLQVVLHELGHHFGIPEERLRELGVY